MKTLNYNLLPKQRSRKRDLKVDIDLYEYTAELFEELERIGIIQRIKEIPQLGVIKVAKSLKKSRYDYTLLQLYLHQLIKTSNLKDQLRISYNNKINATEFRTDYNYIDKNKPTAADIIQLLALIYNIGHFYNTFTASRAIVMMADSNDSFFQLILSSMKDPRFNDAANKILNATDYQQLHLLNSILILNKCDINKPSVSIALEILYSYINADSLPDDNKLKYIFSIFKKIRTVSYIAYDLQIAETPLTIDLCDDKSLLILLRELLSEYNNNHSTNNLIKSITKLLDDTVYNENSNALCYYIISRKMVRKLNKEPSFDTKDYYTDYFLDKDSIFNQTYPQKRDYEQSNILKLTFSKNERPLSEKLLAKLEKIDNTRVGYYDRHLGEQTIVVSVKKNCASPSQITAAYKVLKTVVGTLRQINKDNSTDNRFLLCTKFFLFYLFDKNPLLIRSTINKEICLICTQGKNKRITAIQELLGNSIGNEDQKHEVKFMLNILKEDSTNDTAIMIPASIIVYEKNTVGKYFCEFDGLILYPMRKSEQICFMESKNKKRTPSEAKRCLTDKFDKLTIEYEVTDIETIGHDAKMKYSV